MVGLDNAGKTTILYQLQLGEVRHTVPTIGINICLLIDIHEFMVRLIAGFNVETVEHNGLSMSVWDIGGQEKLRSLWRFYYEGSDAIVFVVDSTDHKRFELAREELSRLFMHEELQGVPLLVLANKQDMIAASNMTSSSGSPSAVATKLGLDTIRDRPWHCQGCSAVGDTLGLHEGMGWLSSQLLQRKR